MTRLNFGPRLDIIGKDEAPDPEDADYHDDIADLFGQVYTEESEPDTFIDGELDFNQ
jgi:hypothetical protein